MSSDDLIPSGRLRTMQIIAAALPLGVVSMAAILLFLAFGPNAQAGALAPTPIISILAGGFLLITGTLSFVVPSVIIKNVLPQLARGSGARDMDALLGLKQTTLIIGLALLEGPAFFGLIAFFIERQPAVLAVPGLALILMAARFPTENHVRNWLEVNARRVAELRQDRV